MQFANKNFKVIGGPIYSLRNKGYSTCMVRPNSSKIIVIDQINVSPMDPLRLNSSHFSPDSLGHVASLGPLIQPLIRFRHHTSRALLPLCFLGVLKLVRTQVAADKAHSPAFHCSDHFSLLLLFRSDFLTQVLFVQWDNSCFHVP
jgi:hypothetical protein